MPEYGVCRIAADQGEADARHRPHAETLQHRDMAMSAADQHEVLDDGWRGGLHEVVSPALTHCGFGRSAGPLARPGGSYHHLGDRASSDAGVMPLPVPVYCRCDPGSGRWHRRRRCAASTTSRRVVRPTAALPRVTQSIFCVGFLMSHVLPCTQFCALICRTIVVCILGAALMTRVLAFLAVLLVMGMAAAQMRQGDTPPLGCTPIGCAQTGMSVLTLGAACNGQTDDTSTINAYLATFTNGGLVYIPAGKQCLINSGNLTIPANVRLVGAAGPVTNAYAPAGVSEILLNPSYTIKLGQGAQLQDLLIQRSTLVANPTAAQVISAVATWGVERSIAVTFPANLGGQALKDLFIIGFNTAVQANAGQFSMSHIAGDDYNGVEVLTAGDNATLDDVRFEPYYALATPVSSGSWACRGIAFNFHDGDTLGGAALTRGFSFMYANAILMSNIGITVVQNSSFEWQSRYGNGLTGAAGIRMVGGCASCTVSNTVFNGFDTPVSDEVSNRVVF